MELGHDQLDVFGYLVNSGGDGHGAVSLERQPRTEMLRGERHRVLAVPQREDRPVPNCHPDPKSSLSPTRRRRLDHYRNAISYRIIVASSTVSGQRGATLDFPQGRDRRAPGPLID